MQSKSLLMTLKLKCFYLILLSFLSLELSSQNLNFAELEEEELWVDSIMSRMSLNDQIAQLLVVRVNTPSSEAEMDKIVEELKKLKAGGLTFFAGHPIDQARLTNKIQSAMPLPMLITIDGEWGLAMRLTETTAFPYQMALGAIQGENLIYDMGEEIARQCKRMGIHINFAPVVDINNNPANPVINYRSFGENKYNVAKKGYAYAKGMEDHGILSSIKHFPGHGDTGTDSHYALPMLNHSRDRMDSLELYPFKYSIDRGISGVMVGHLNIPALGVSKDEASSLSPEVVTDLLKNELGFKGITMTDALEMKGVASHFSAGRAAVESFKAGNDILLLPEDNWEAIKAMETAIRKGEIKEAELNERCRRILRLKFRLGLNKTQQVEENNLLEELNTPQAELMNRKLMEAALTVLQNNDSLLPLKNLETIRIASVSVGLNSTSKFQEGLSRYTLIDHFQIDTKGENLKSLPSTWDKYDLVILGLHETQIRPRNNQLYSENVYEWIEKMIDEKRVVLSLFRNAYTLTNIKNAGEVEALIVTYMDNEMAEDLSSQLIFGGVGASGRLPVSVENFKEGTGLDLRGGLRFKYTIPEELGIDSKKLERRIDEIVSEGITKGAFPGSEVFLAKDQKVFFHKTYGYHTYENTRPVNKTDLYDFASVTKITGPLPALMQLHDAGKFDLEGPMKDDLPFLKWSNKRNLQWRQVLAHNAQLKSWIPYWTTTIKKNGKFRRNTLSYEPSDKYNFQIADSLYMYGNYRDKIYKMIKKSELNEKPGYVYSGLSFYLFPELIENKTGMEYETYLKENIYRPLGAHTLTYNPLRYHKLDDIVPTEKDTFFRKMQLHGVVHDEGAAMMKGVSGNAGLFGTANDLAKLMQMYLNGGHYGGRQFISEQTMRKFSSCQYCHEGNFRGLGFDKPRLENKQYQTAAWDASFRSFGHSGYTGTFTWVDPENDLLYVFFSNRVYPTRNNPLIGSLNIRPRIHQVVYDLLEQK